MRPAFDSRPPAADASQPHAPTALRRLRPAIDSRPSQFYTWNVVMPIVFLVVLSFGQFFLGTQPVQLRSRLGYSVTLVLTLFTFKSSVGDSLPAIAYLTILDKFVIQCLVIILIITFELIFVCVLIEAADPSSGAFTATGGVGAYQDPWDLYVGEYTIETVDPSNPPWVNEGLIRLVDRTLGGAIFFVFLVFFAQVCAANRTRACRTCHLPPMRTPHSLRRARRLRAVHGEEAPGAGEGEQVAGGVEPPPQRLPRHLRLLQLRGQDRFGRQAREATAEHDPRRQALARRSGQGQAPLS